MDRVKRKVDHIEHTLSQSLPNTHSFDDITFVHQSIPNMKVEDVNLSTKIGELIVSSPIFINAMTGGGGERTFEINQMLAKIAAKNQMAVAVGSQMSALKDRLQRKSYEVVRKENPNGIVIGNLGSEATIDQAKAAVEMIHADALQIHLNVVQELVMPEGDRDFTSALKRIETIIQNVEVPVIIKEVGYGISRETACQLVDIGVKTIDVGGSGGTNFSKIENLRRDHQLTPFNDWGIPTTAAICEVKQTYPDLSVIGSGGILDTLHIAKALALGASSVGVAGVFLRKLTNEGEEALDNFVKMIHEELSFLMTALGVSTVDQLQDVPLIINGKTYHWLNERGINTKTLANRVKKRQ